MSGFSVVEKVRYVVTTLPVSGVPANALLDELGIAITTENTQVITTET